MSLFYTVRIWVDGELVLKRQLTALMDPSSDFHLVVEAEKDGKVWQLEIEDPAQPPENRFLRFGTDSGGMVDPQQHSLDAIFDVAKQRWGT